MSWAFRKRVKIIPGVSLNLSKSGISTNIGVRGANVNLGKKGAYLNTGIPGSGLSHRQRLSSGNKSDRGDVPIQSQSDYVEPAPADNIVSADVENITSQDMEGVKQAILLAHQQQMELKVDILKVKSALTFTRFKLLLSYLFIIGFIRKEITENLKEDIERQKIGVRELREAVENSFVHLDVHFSDELEREYQSLLDSFVALSGSKKIWDVTGAYSEDRAKTRSSASRVIKKNPTKIGLRQLPYIKSKYEAMYFQNLNGADIYIYPNFIVMFEAKKKFAVIDYQELEFKFKKTRFLETDKIPSDSKVIDKTWAKVNKNGTPDKRFKGNYQIPIVGYGDIIMRTRSGMNENWQFSNMEYCIDFGDKFSKYQMTIQGLTDNLGEFV